MNDKYKKDYWSEEELTILKQGIAEKWHIYQIKQQLPKRQYLGIITKARQIAGFADPEPEDDRRSQFKDPKKTVKDVYPSHDRLWMPNEIQILENSFDSGKSFAYIAKLLDRAVSAVMQKLYKLHSENTNQINDLFKRAISPVSKGNPKKDKGLKIYVASSWRNEFYPEVVSALREAGHEVYDFRNPPSGGNGFKWSMIDPDYLEWSPETFREQLQTNPLAQAQLKNDLEALRSCDACVLVLPCGRSAHTEAGWMAGAGKRVIAYIPCKQEPELMYGLFDAVCTSIDELIECLRCEDSPTH